MKRSESERMRDIRKLEGERDQVRQTLMFGSAHTEHLTTVSLHVKTPQGDVTLQVRLHQSVAQTKTQLAAHTGGSASEIALRFGAITLHDEAKSLSAYGISGGDSLALTPTKEGREEEEEEGEEERERRSKEQAQELEELMSRGLAALKGTPSGHFRFGRLYLVGEGRAGKTALSRSLQGRVFEETESTVGVSNALMEVERIELEGGGTKDGEWRRYVPTHKELEQAQARIVANASRKREDGGDSPQEGEGIVSWVREQSGAGLGDRRRGQEKTGDRKSVV